MLEREDLKRWLFIEHETVFITPVFDRMYYGKA